MRVYMCVHVPLSIKGRHQIRIIAFGCIRIVSMLHSDGSCWGLGVCIRRSKPYPLCIPIHFSHRAFSFYTIYGCCSWLGRARVLHIWLAALALIPPICSSLPRAPSPWRASDERASAEPATLAAAPQTCPRLHPPAPHVSVPDYALVHIKPCAQEGCRVLATG